MKSMNERLKFMIDTGCMFFFCFFIGFNLFFFSCVIIAFIFGFILPTEQQIINWEMAFIIISSTAGCIGLSISYLDWN